TNPVNQIEQRLGVAGLHLVTTRLRCQRRLKADYPTRLTQFDCNKALRRLIIDCGGRGVLDAAFHWSLLCDWWWWTTAPLPPRPLRLHRILTRASIFLRKDGLPGQARQ